MQNYNSKLKIKNIFAAVFDKKVLDPLLDVLDKRSVKFWGTEGTVEYLKKKGFSARSVVSGFDFDGRVKSLDRKVFAAILADKSKQSHICELRKLKIESFDLMVVDLYAPHKKDFPESMDIGGQSLIRSSIKNYKSVALAYDKNSLESLVGELVK